MFLGYQNEKIKFYTKTPLDMVLYNLDKIEETDEEYILNGDEYVLKDEEWEHEHFEQVKALKLKEAETKCTEKRYNQTFTVELQEQECEFDTTEQTQSDLQTAAIVTSSGGTYDNWVTNNGVVLNLTMQDVQTVFAQFFSLVSPLYTKQLEYIQEINACTTAEEVENIVINYSDEPIEETNEEYSEEGLEEEYSEIEKEPEVPNDLEIQEE